MGELPLSVVISALIKDGKILLIKRVKGDYVGFLGLPGGKVEKSEHLSDAAVREILEESGIKASFKSHLGFVSEHLIENGNVLQHFLLHVCELIPNSVEITTNNEGDLAWFDLNKLEGIKSQIIPSDYLIIQRIIKDREANYYNCVIEKSGEEFVLRQFSSL